MRQRLLVIEHRAEIAHVEPTAACFAFPKMLGFGQRRATGLLADDFPRGRGVSISLMALHLCHFIFP
jgi:hypothetical protein